MVKSCDFNLFYTASKLVLQTPTIYKKLLQLHTNPAIRNSNTVGVNFFKLAKFTQTPHLFAVRRLSMLKSQVTHPSLASITSLPSPKLFNGSLSSSPLIYGKNFLHIQGSFLPNYNTALQPDRRWKLKFLTLDYARVSRRNLLKQRAATLRTVSKKHLLRASYQSSTGTHNPKLTKSTLYNTLFKILRTSVLGNVNTSPMFNNKTNIRLKRTRVRIKRLFNWYTSRPFLFTNTRPGKVIFSDNFLKSTLFTLQIWTPPLSYSISIYWNLTGFFFFCYFFRFHTLRYLSKVYFPIEHTNSTGREGGVNWSRIKHKLCPLDDGPW